MASEYILHYWPVIPGRGEFIRLALESVKCPYTEKNKPWEIVMKVDKEINSPHFAPPLLEVIEEKAFISQTPAILAYLAPDLGLDGKPSRISKSILKAQIDQITLTILDLNNEVHDVHHPVSSAENYEDQKTEALRRATDFRKNRVPKFFSLFQITLETNSESKQWLIGSSFTTADLALYQVVDGLHFAFPRLMSALKKGGEYKSVFALRDSVAELDTIKNYLQSDRRKPYSNGIFRYYPELDGEE